MPDSGGEEALAPLQSFVSLMALVWTSQRFPSTAVQGCMPSSQTGEGQCWKTIGVKWSQNIYFKVLTQSSQSVRSKRKRCAAKEKEHLLKLKVTSRQNETGDCHLSSDTGFLRWLPTHLSHCQHCDFMLPRSSLFCRGFSYEAVRIYFYIKGTMKSWLKMLTHWELHKGLLHGQLS